MTKAPEYKVGQTVRVNKGQNEILGSYGVYAEIEFTGTIKEDRGNLVILECQNKSGKSDIAYVNKKHIKETLK